MDNKIDSPAKKAELRRKLEKAMSEYKGKVTVLPSFGNIKLEVTKFTEGLHKTNLEVNLWVSARDGRLYALARHTGKSKDFIVRACNGEITLSGRLLTSLRNGMRKVEEYERV